ncbi:hypothetical protein [Fodinicurvata halophila]|uniref:hypothetical protein n=1 Tax=Fodinicurvata halophila TaxID=1419723 RepID=UPI003641273A
METAPPFDAALTQWWQTYGRKYRMVIACERHEAGSAFDLARDYGVHAVEIVDARGAQLASYPFSGVDALQRHLPDVCVADCAVDANERAERAARAAAPLARCATA